MCLLINRLGMTLHNAVLYLKLIQVVRGRGRARLHAFQIENKLLRSSTGIGVADTKNEVSRLEVFVR